MGEDRKWIKRRIILTLSLFCMGTAASGFGFLNVRAQNSLVTIEEENVALSSTIRPDQNYFGSTLLMMMALLILFLVYFYKRECKRQIEQMLLINNKYRTDRQFDDNVNLCERWNLLYLKRKVEEMKEISDI